MYRTAVILLCVCAACRGTPKGRGGGPSPMVEPIASAWCQHHVTCGRVAPSKRFHDLETCLGKTRARVAKELGGCTADDAKLSACLSAIQYKTCDAFGVVTPEACERLCE